MNFVVENEGEKYNGAPYQGMGCCLTKLTKPRSSKNVAVETTHRIKNQPRKRNNKNTQEEFGINRDLVPQCIQMHPRLILSERKERSPNQCCSQ
jgi:hypothetical protein